ncbi:hypothetical protein [Streptomyces sp. NPDC056061]|uniref:hypothetical protein n=1 Tax=Streptomyces sp. NPDC056061 TaxID=3345700 RepID=UPI0035D68B37
MTRTLTGRCVILVRILSAGGQGNFVDVEWFWLGFLAGAALSDGRVSRDSFGSRPKIGRRRSGFVSGGAGRVRRIVRHSNAVEYRIHDGVRIATRVRSADAVSARAGLVGLPIEKTV